MKKFPLMRTTETTNYKDIIITSQEIKATGITYKGKFYPCDDEGRVKDLVIEPYQPYQIETE